MNGKLHDRVRGALIGGAIGDALGYPIEFRTLNAIKQKYGPTGYNYYQEFNNVGKAIISDDRSIMDKYPSWDFYLIDPSTADGCYAVFINQLEKEFAVEIAHLWDDGTLHRIYHLTD